MPWNPDQYRQFQAARAASFEDMLSLIQVRAGLRVIDLGCGSGELTARLADHLPGSDVLGIDSSAEMIAQAEALIRPGLRFEHAAIESLGGEWDLVFSHAALQWVPDHAALIPRLLGMVSPGGQIVVQVPSDHDHPARGLLRATAQEEPFRTALNGWLRPQSTLSIAAYTGLLFEHGAQVFTVFEKTYPAVLENVDAVIDWYTGTALVPYFERLPYNLHRPFLNRFRERLTARWPSGPVLYTGNRILFAATQG
jgi:trans-aconitate 2-methyltransferase